MDAARQAKREAAARQAAEQLAEAAQVALDLAGDIASGEATAPELRRAVDRLTRQCSGVLPGGVRAAWRALNNELLVSGDTGRIDPPLTAAVEEFTAALAAEFDVEPHIMEDVHDPDREYTGSRIPAGDYFAGVGDGSPHGLVDVGEGEEAGDRPAEEAGGTEGN